MSVTADWHSTQLLFSPGSSLLCNYESKLKGMEESSSKCRLGSCLVHFQAISEGSANCTISQWQT